jgi:hypothetical protein
MLYEYFKKLDQREKSLSPVNFPPGWQHLLRASSVWVYLMECEPMNNFFLCKTWVRIPAGWPHYWISNHRTICAFASKCYKSLLVSILHFLIFPSNLEKAIF